MKLCPRAVGVDTLYWSDLYWPDFHLNQRYIQVFIIHILINPYIHHCHVRNFDKYLLDS